jgi:hypothetical protein
MNIKAIYQRDYEDIFKTRDAEDSEDLALSMQLVYLVAYVFFIGFGSQKNPM